MHVALIRPGTDPRLRNVSPRIYNSHFLSINYVYHFNTGCSLLAHRFESHELLPFRSLGIFVLFTTPQLARLYESVVPYLPIDRGGDVNGYYLRVVTAWFE